MGVDVNTFHQEFRNLLDEKSVVLVSGVDRNNVRLNMGFVTEDVVDDISRWWRKYYNCPAQGIRGKLKMFRGEENFSYDEEVKLKDGYVYLSYISSRDYISSREFEFIFITNSGCGVSNTQYFSNTLYKLVTCI